MAKTVNVLFDFVRIIDIYRSATVY